MGRLILFWMNRQPDDNIPTTAWIDYQNAMAFVLLVVLVLFTGLILVAYRQSAQAKLIRYPSDLFGRYTPLYWLAVSVVPIAILFGLAWYDYGKRFQEFTQTSYTGGAAVIGVWAGFLTLVLASAILPVLTPPKFRYRTWRALIRW